MVSLWRSLGTARIDRFFCTYRRGDVGNICRFDVAIGT